jgi:hypothetical protein
MSIILQRRKASGFVKYPKDFAKRIVDGTARFRTRCDVLVGPCACGGVHQESDEWVQDLLDNHDAKFELLVLAPDDSGLIHLPRYWIKPRRHENCTVLSGKCACGAEHKANESWVRALLSSHEATIVGCPEADLDLIPDQEISVQDDQLEGVSPGCPCEHCEAVRCRHTRNRMTRGTV